MEYNIALISSSESSMEKVEKNYSNYLDMNKQERMEFLKRVMAGGDCERFTILPKSAILHHVKSLGLEDLD